MSALVTVDRARWLGHRWHRHGLDGDVGLELDDLLLLGFQDSRGGGAAQSIAARTGRSGVGHTITVNGPLVSMWSVRGAPHVHRIEDLDLVRDALAPAPTGRGRLGVRRRGRCGGRGAECRGDRSDSQEHGQP